MPLDLSAIARAVMDQSMPLDQEVVGEDGRRFILRALPYRTDDSAVQGIVLSFVDLTTLRNSDVELKTAREQLTEELRRTTRLHALGVELLAPGDMATVLNETLRAALDITGADMGHIQMTDEHGALTIRAQSGFDGPFLDFFARVNADYNSVCGHAFATERRVAVEDINASPILAGSPTLSVLRAAGVGAVQSTPLFARSGALIGMLSTHYRSPHRFGETEARWLDLLALRATHLVHQAHLEQQLRDAKSNLERMVADRTRRLQLALDAAQAGTWRLDLRANQVRWDERSRAMFDTNITGTQPLESILALVHPDDRPRLRKRLQEMQTRGDDTWNMTFRVVRSNGGTVWVHGVGRAERSADGRLIALGGINLDVTGQHRTEEALLESRTIQREMTEIVRSLLSASANGILSTTGDGIIENANAALEAMFGYAPGELSGRSIDLLIPQAYRAQHARQHADFWKAPQSRPMGQGLDVIGQRKDGSTFPIEVSLTHIATSGGGRVLAFVTDITQRKRAEDELRRSHAALQAQADQLRHRTEQLRRLASDLTLSEQQTRERLAKTLHDHLQQLLFSAKLRIDRLAASDADQSTDTTGLAARARDDLEQAIAAARSLSVELFPPQLHIGGLAAAITWLATTMKEKYGLTVEVAADSRATLDDKDLRTLAFESVRELLFDVVKHAKVNRAAVSLTLTSDDRIRISVADEGVGFDPAAVFNATAPPVGWGLFSIRERAELLGGRLEVASAPGRGTRFTLIIPRSEASAKARGSLRILIADDHAVARAGLHEILTERSEFEIVGEASTGAEAVALAQSLRPDAIVMDVAMPEMDGVEATRRIHAANSAIQIFGLSTQVRPESLHAIEQAGAVGYFCKGDDAQQLIERLLALHEEVKAKT